MNRLPVWLFATLACKPAPYDPGLGGVEMLNYFPFEHNEACEWTFENQNRPVGHRMRATVTDAAGSNGIDTFEISFVEACSPDSASCVDGTLIRRMHWSVEGNRGLELTGIDGPDTSHTFDPPLQFVNRFMTAGEVIDSEANGASYRSELVGFGNCHMLLDTFDGCAEIQLTSSDGIAEVLGTYWAIHSFNIVAIDWPDQGGRWFLVDHTVAPQTR